MTDRNSRTRLLRLSKLFGALAIVVLLIGIGVSWVQHKDNQAQGEAPEGTSSEPAPSTEKRSDYEFKNYQVAPDAPRYIFIPKISVKAMVKPVGVTEANQIESPRNVFDAGWYTGSAKPGRPGAMVVDGHISSWETHGVFYKLKELKSGNTITIERGDGTVLTYRVAKSQTYDADKVDMTAALAPVNPNKPGLNLVSCTGKVVKGTNDFDKRIVVFAEQM